MIEFFVLAILLRQVVAVSSDPAPDSAGSVSKVEMVTPMALIYKVLVSSISTFETPPENEPRRHVGALVPCCRWKSDKQWRLGAMLGMD
jgi:hypothetical protein